MVILAAAMAFAAGTAFAAPVQTVSSAKGDVLAGENGMTLYTFKKDEKGKSNCYDKCAANWPPLMAPEAAKPMGGYSVVVRDDGKKQWAYKGKPVYAFAKDTKAGDKTGDGFLNGAWHIAK